MPLEKIHYINTSDMTPEEKELFRELVGSYEHNNGYAFTFWVEGPSKNPEYASGWPEVNAWLIAQGVKVGEYVIIHSVW